MKTSFMPVHFLYAHKAELNDIPAMSLHTSQAMSSLNLLLWCPFLTLSMILSFCMYLEPTLSCHVSMLPWTLAMAELFGCNSFKNLPAQWIKGVSASGSLFNH